MFSLLLLNASVGCPHQLRMVPIHYGIVPQVFAKILWYKHHLLSDNEESMDHCILVFYNVGWFSLFHRLPNPEFSYLYKL